MNNKKTDFKLHKKTIFEFFYRKRKNYKKIIIPLYQRGYSWNDEHIESLIDDIFDRYNDEDEHYFGIIATSILNEDDETWTRLIDGQQRVTTSIILVNKILEMISKIKNEKRIFIKDKFEGLEFKHEIETEESDDIKKILNLNYNFIFKSLKLEKISSKIEEYINEKQKNESNKIDLEKFLNVFLKKFNIGELQYEINKDKEMLVFENLNSKGTPLKEFDLIRNLLISISDNSDKNSKEKLKKFNQKIWNIINSGKLELNLSQDKKKAFFEIFIENFLTFKTGKKLLTFSSYPKYKNLKKWIETFDLKEKKFEFIINEIQKYFILYVECNKPKLKKEKNHQNRLFYKDIWINSSYQNKYIHTPYIFAIFNKFSSFDEKKLEWKFDDNKNKQKIRSYIKIWTIYLIKLMSVRGTGQSLLTKVLDITKLLNKNKKPSEISNKLRNSNLEPTPSNQEFEDSLSQKPKQKWLNKCILNIIDYFSTNEVNEFISYQHEKTLEHIMPKNPKSENWKNLPNFEKDHELSKDLIGNYVFLDKRINSKASDKSFETKKTDYFQKSSSPLIKNRNIFGSEIKPLLEYSKWNFETIKERTKALTKIIIKIMDKDT